MYNNYQCQTCGKNLVQTIIQGQGEHAICPDHFFDPDGNWVVLTETQKRLAQLQGIKDPTQVLALSKFLFQH